LSANDETVGLSELLTEGHVSAILPARPEDANKGTFGKVMVVAGSVNYVGAAALATQGAMRVGAGLATLAPPGDLLSMLAAKLTECTFLPLPSDMGVIASHASEKVRGGLDGYSALLVGCGIGTEKETVGFLRNLLAQSEAPTRPSSRLIGFASRVSQDEGKGEEETKKLPPLVLDGDALNILAEWEEWHKTLPQETILTPHAGEMARLLGSTVDEVQANRVALAAQSAAKWNCVVVLKGAGTVVAEPSGKVYISSFSNPALATAGTGDVLAGAIAGLRAQGLGAVDAACAGVFLHGLAGEMLGEEFGPAGGLAGDLPLLLARAQKRVRSYTSTARQG
jgi:NAD(P)H-hydrate repair Nnr-like enzyme with NAD(P)H-hydrate dehydratase domain